MSVVPPPEIISITEDTDVTFGDAISLSCVVESPINVTITWSTTTGVALPEPSLSGDLDSNITSTITIDTATLAHEGDYMCTAVNTAGMDEDNITLSIIGVCVCVSFVPSIHGWAERTLGFSCLHMHEIFPEIWETVLFLIFFCVWNIRITVYSST